MQFVQEVRSVQSRGGLVGEGVPLVNGIVFLHGRCRVDVAASVHVSSCSVSLVGEEILCVSVFFFLVTHWPLQHMYPQSL